MPDAARDFAEFALMGHDLQSSKAQCLEPRYYATTQSGNRIHSNVVLINQVANGILWSGSVDDVR